jgi:hypothetical protein
MLSDMDDINDLDRIMITDVISIENLLSIKSKGYDEVLEDFLASRKKYDTSSLSHFCLSHYAKELNGNDSEFDNFVKSFLR